MAQSMTSTFPRTLISILHFEGVETISALLPALMLSHLNREICGEARIHT
jgi:hypothetical protein